MSVGIKTNKKEIIETNPIYKLFKPLMMYRINLKALFLILISFLPDLILHANDGAYEIGPQGGSIYPINNKYIQMLSEVVIYDQRKGEFSTTFVFHNTSDSVQKVTFGFPVFPAENSEDYYNGIKVSKEKQIAEINKELQFRTWVNNEEVLRKVWAIDTTDDYRFAFVMTIEFQPKETKTIVNKFKQGFGYGGDNMGRNWKDIAYILKSGAGWKGAIKDVKVVFKMNLEENILSDSSHLYADTYFLGGLDDFFGYRIYRYKNTWTYSPEPTNIDYDKNIINWEFKDLEPDFNIKLTKMNDDFDILCLCKFLDYLDTLSSYIISNDTIRFNAYYDKLRRQKDLFRVNKEYCEVLYEQYGEDFLTIHKSSEDFSQYKTQTRHIINAYAALNGYKFSNKMWYKMFQLFDWYNPQTRTPLYDTIQKKNIDNLKLFEEGKFKEPVVEKETQLQPEIKYLAYKKDNQDKTMNIKKEDSNSYLLLSILVVFVLVISGFIIIRKKKNNLK